MNTNVLFQIVPANSGLTQNTTVSHNCPDCTSDAALIIKQRISGFQQLKYTPLKRIYTIWLPLESLLHRIFGDCTSSRSLFGSFTCMFLECYFHKVHIKIENLFFALTEEGKIPKKFNIGIFFPPSREDCI